MFDPLSGPKASPFDAKKPVYNATVGAAFVNDPANISTGALQTGIGFGSPPIFGLTAPQSIKDRGFTDDYTPGITKPSGVAATDSTLVYIGGGRSVITNGLSVPSPYDESMVGLCMAGNGGSRDGGTTPFTGFPVKTVTAVGSVANGVDVEAGFKNRSGVTIVVGQSVFGSSDTPNADVT
jgi:hypothetical protein